MAELSRFLGIIISLMFFDNIKHHKPHVHVKYGEYEASIAVDGEILAGRLPSRQFKIVVGWLATHQDEVYEAWNKAMHGKPFDKIKN
ncbi:MAG: DUF4160 domain-containing protein [Spirochaetaceae bacterium]|nr:DUF4160 domain-containing protein [Spirochaetaceae bacterium]